jgi:hypothetical protein
VLTRDVTLEESRSTLDLQTLFTYCVQGVLDNCQVNPRRFYGWKDGQHIIETYLDPEAGNQPVAALAKPELIDQLSKCLDAWLIQEGSL